MSPRRIGCTNRRLRRGPLCPDHQNHRSGRRVLTELPLETGYECGASVHGVVRRSSTQKFDRIERFRDRVTLDQTDLLEERSLLDAVRVSAPAWPPDLHPGRDLVRRGRETSRR